MEAKDKQNFISSEWEGLEPDSPVWTEELLESVACEIATREDPAKAPESSESGDMAEVVRLRSELARLRQDYGALEKKYTSLIGQFQALAGRRKK